MNSAGLKTVYIVTVFLGLALTAAALFTPGWRHYKYRGGPYFGLITYTCGSGNHQVNWDECDHWWRDKQSWEKAVIVMMFIALVVEIVVFLSSLSTYCTTFRAYIPLSVLTFLAILLLLIAIILYGAKNHSKVAYMSAASTELNANHVLGYSYWLAVAGTIVMAIATIMGFVLSSQAPLDRPPFVITN